MNPITQLAIALIIVAILGIILVIYLQNARITKLEKAKFDDESAKLPDMEVGTKAEEDKFHEGFIIGGGHALTSAKAFKLETSRTIQSFGRG